MNDPQQLRDLRRLRRTIEEEGLTSCMNDTKWRAIITAIKSVSDYRPRFRARCVQDGADPTCWDGSFPWHMPRFVDIEWLEFDPVVRTRRGALVPDLKADFSDRIVAALAEVRVPVSVGESRKVVYEVPVSRSQAASIWGVGWGRIAAMDSRLK